jgi:uncharacterized protein (TIGR03086 family)
MTDTFSKTVQLPVSPDEAFALVTQPERLRRWQTVSAYVDLRAGGEYRWTVTPGHHAHGTFREVEPGKRVVFGWGWDGNPDLPKDASTVTITIDPVEGGSQVTLTHEGLTAEQAAMHAEGWHHYLARLETAAATGDAGQDEWAWAPENLDPFVAADATLAVLQPILRALTAEDRPKQTPCTDFTCHELAEHLFGSLTQLGAMAGATVTVPEVGSLEDKVSVMADQALTAWRGYDGETVVGGGLPAYVAQMIFSIEFLLHAWDFAQASGQTVKVSDEVVAWVAGNAKPIIDGGRERGSFGPEVAAAEGASVLDAFAAFAGRTPISA